MEDKKKIDLASFTRMKERMVATNDATIISRWGINKYTDPVRDYSIDEIKRIIQSASLSEQQQLSKNYFLKDGFYKRLIIYYATLLKYMGILIPNPALGQSLSTPKLKKRYYSALDFVENSSLKAMMVNFAQKALVDGTYFGVIQKLDKDSIVVLDLPSDYCSSNFKDLYGNDIIQFNVAYFDSIIDEEIREKILLAYPKIIVDSYRKYKKGKLKNGYVFIPSDIGVCFPFFDGRPLFIDVIPATVQYEEAVDIEKERNLEEIRKIIVQKIPHLNDGTLLFEPDEANEMHSGAVGMLRKNPNISVLTTYADVDAIVSKTSAEANNNNLEKMYNNIYNIAGTSAEIFASTGSNTLGTSLNSDLALMMIFANKVSRFITYNLNTIFGNQNINFKYDILPVTWYNEKDYISTSLQMAQSGYSFIVPAIAQGMTQKDLTSIKELENDIMNLGEMLIPLASSYTQSTEVIEDPDKKGGAPKKDEEEKSEKTIENEKSLDNQTGGSD